MPESQLPTEVELIYEIMPCNAMRTAQEPGETPHSCSYFRRWGTYHSYDYSIDGAPIDGGIEHESVYVGRAPLLPEALSGCRKSPILTIGINPNLPGWWSSRRSSVYPLFDDYRQFAHYFRYRTTSKLEIPPADYERFGGGSHDNPFSKFELDVPPNTEGKRVIPLRQQAVTMYDAYQSLLDSLAEGMGWDDHALTVGEDIAYGNMVACPSARWTTRPVTGDPSLPPMTVGERRGIVGECFKDREYFLRQLFQSLPSVLMIFSQATANAFIGVMHGRFIEGDPEVGDPIANLMKRPIRMEYGMLPDGTQLTTRVIFSPHITGDPTNFAPARARVVEQLIEEADAGNLQFNASTKHLRRPPGSCTFCTMLKIGNCDYEDELRPFAEVMTLAADSGVPIADPVAEKRTQQGLIANVPALQAAADKGWESSDDEIQAQLDDSEGGTSAASEAGADSGAILFAEPEDIDVGPTFILRGRIVTMNQRNNVIDDGRVIVSKGKIAKILAEAEAIPAEFESASEVDTKGTIYPGLFDLHNHFVYNILPLWVVPERYVNRSQWPRHPEYITGVSRPIKRVLATYSESSKAIVRYVEAKGLLSGTTTGQGIRTQVKGGSALFRGAMRSVEATSDPRLPQARTMVPDLSVTGATGPERIEAFRRALEQQKEKGAAFFYHLSEGIDKSARKHFINLQDNDLLESSLVGIHSLGLAREDLYQLAEADAGVVWSPFSNMLLYGQTLNLSNLKGSGVRFSIGCDWAPSGSKNLLQELKIASFENHRQGGVFTSKELVQAVTSGAAELAGWEGSLGTIKAGAFADLMVIDGKTGDVYDHLIAAVEENVRLVIIHGTARYGDRELIEKILPLPTSVLEDWMVGARKKAFYLFTENSPINDVTFQGAMDTLTEAMRDLPVFVERMEAGRAHLAGLGEIQPEEFTIELDNEFEEDDPLVELDAGGFDVASLLVDDSAINESIPLDGPLVACDEYFKRITDQKNISEDLKVALKNAYGVD